MTALIEARGVSRSFAVGRGVLARTRRLPSPRWRDRYRRMSGFIHGLCSKGRHPSANQQIMRLCVANQMGLTAGRDLRYLDCLNVVGPIAYGRPMAAGETSRCRSP